MKRERGLLGFEAKHHPVLPRLDFLFRLGRSAAVTTGIVVASLVGGMLGYHLLEDLPWVDSFLNAAMILGGMGPVDPMRTDAGKIFAGCYALYSGLLVIVSAGVLLAPVVHRILHKFHAASDAR